MKKYDSGNNTERTIRFATILYAIGLSVIAALIIAAILLIAGIVASHSKAALAVNIAGREHMLFAMLGILLFTIAAEAFLIFRPVILRFKKDAEQLKRLSDFNILLSEVNHAIANAFDEVSFANRLCGLTVDRTNAKLACLLMPDEEGWFRTMAASGAVDYIESVKISSKEEIPEGMGMIGTTWRDARTHDVPSIAEASYMKPWKEAAIRFGLASTISLPIFRNKKIWAVFAVYYHKKNLFDDQLREILEELARDIGSGLERIENRNIQNALFNSSASGVFLIKDRAIRKMNARAALMLGYETSELEGISSRIIYADESDWIRVGDSYSEISSLGNTAIRSVRVKKKDGGILIGDFFGTRIDGREELTVWTIEDVTGRENARVSLDYERGFLKTLIQTLPDLIWLKDINGVFLASNHTFEKLLGAKEEDIIGKTDYDFVDKELADSFLENDRIAIEKGRSSMNEEWVTFADDGHRALIETTKTPMLDGNGNIIGVLGIGHDITERRKAEDALRESGQRYEAVLTGTKDGFLMFDPDGKILEVNDAYCEHSGYSREELLNMQVSQLIAGSDKEKVLQRIEKVVKEGSSIFESRYRRKNGSIWPVEASISYSHEHGGRLFSFSRDITERKLLEQLSDLRQQLTEIFYANDHKQLMQKALDVMESATESRIGFFHFLEDGGTISLQTWSSRTLKEMCFAKGEGRHYPVNEAGVWVDCILQGKPVIHNDYESLPNKKGLPEGHAPVIRELTVPVFRDKKIVAVIGVGNKPSDYDDYEAELVSRLADAAYDFVERKQAENKIEFMAFNDVLTGLPNRQLFSDRLQQAISLSKRSKKPLAICYLDLDGFKPVNDRYGHDVGDELLIKLSKRLQQELREGDTLARLGGDEFAILLNELGSIFNGEEIIDRIFHAISEPFDVKGRRIHISASIGATFFPDDDSNPDTLLRHADQAMYKAKQSGKAAFKLYDPIQNNKFYSFRRTLSEFDEAIHKSQLTLYYQPKINLRTGDLAGVEALVRWQHPEKGLLMPGEFLPVIKNSPLEIALDEWVLKQAIEQHLSWKEQGLNVAVSVNISPRHIQQAAFPGYLAGLISSYPEGLSEYIELEILETSAIGDTGRVAEIMRECAKLGIRFSLDDFGTGYSSLTYFHSLPISVVKIDQNFVRAMIDDSRDQDIVEGVLRLAKALNRPVVAEGVESLELGMMLLDMGCEYGQGYGIAKPMPADSLFRWAGHWKLEGYWHQLQSEIHDSDGKYDLQVAIFTHRHWIEKVKIFIKTGLKSELPDLDPTSCQFSHWYHGIGFARYGNHPSYPFILAKHDEVHAIAQKLVIAAEAKPNETALLKFDDLTEAGDKLIVLLQRLSQVNTN